jgi:hypothetical protein
VSSSDKSCDHRRPGERTISTSEWNRREDAALAEQDYEDARERDRMHDRGYATACHTLYRFRAGDKAALVVDALEEHIGALAELGTIARLRSKLALLPDGPVKTALTTLLED